MKSIIVSILALTVLTGTALAAIPSTFDYLLATQPMISGKVAAVNDHSLTVDTDQGGQVTLAVDSKTMVPTDLAVGMPMRVEFKAMPDGHKYARRIIPIRGGMNTGRELAYGRSGGHAEMQYASSFDENTRPSRWPVNAIAATRSRTSAAASNTVVSAVWMRGPVCVSSRTTHCGSMCSS